MSELTAQNLYDLLQKLKDDDVDLSTVSIQVKHIADYDPTGNDQDMNLFPDSAHIVVDVHGNVEVTIED